MVIKMSEGMLTAALEYTERGFSVIPVHSLINSVCSCKDGKLCKSPGKHPAVHNWRKYQRKALTAEQLIRIWKMFPERNVGIVTGKISGIWVLDIDGPEGIGSLKKAGFTKFPDTPIVKTGGGGHHVYFKYPDDDTVIKNSAGKILPSVDVRGEGGFVVAPPSVHKSGKRYEWV